MLSKFYKSKSTLLLAFMMLASFAAMAQPKAPSTLSNPLAQMLVFIMILLLVAIAILGNVVNSAASLFREKIRKEREAAQSKQDTGNSALAIIVLLVSGLLVSFSTLAQDAAATAAATAPEVAKTFNGLSAFTFYLMVSVIAVEILILIVLVYQLKFLVGIESKRVMKAQAETKHRESWWWRLNKSVRVEEEKDIDLSHDYDGISELDNKLPPWWIAAFAVTIIFAGVYMWRYHVSHSAPLQIEELEIAMKEAEAEKAEYLSKSASNVDESSVTMLDAAGIAAGKALFGANCIACHGNSGEGGPVGPNLSDKYWLHGGSINDVFKTIKYGVVEKGMRSWKDDFSPMQLAQLASFVRSLQGTNPANAKEPQGDLYEEGGGAAPVTDSTSTAAAGK